MEATSIGTGVASPVGGGASPVGGGGASPVGGISSVGGGVESPLLVTTQAGRLETRTRTVLRRGAGVGAGRYTRSFLHGAQVRE